MSTSSLFMIKGLASDAIVQIEWSCPPMKNERIEDRPLKMKDIISEG